MVLFKWTNSNCVVEQAGNDRCDNSMPQIRRIYRKQTEDFEYAGIDMVQERSV